MMWKTALVLGLLDTWGLHGSSISHQLNQLNTTTKSSQMLQSWLHCKRACMHTNAWLKLHWSVSALCLMPRWTTLWPPWEPPACSFAHEAMCIMLFPIILVQHHSHTHGLLWLQCLSATVATSDDGHLEQIAARRWFFLTALQPITCQKHKHTCTDIQQASPAQQLQQNTETVLPRFTSLYIHICSYSYLESEDYLTNACRPAVKTLLCHFWGLIPDSGTSIQQGFASDVLFSIAVCMHRLLLAIELNVWQCIRCNNLSVLAKWDMYLYYNHHSDGGRLESNTLHVVMITVMPSHSSIQHGRVYIHKHCHASICVVWFRVRLQVVPMLWHAV